MRFPHLFLAWCVVAVWAAGAALGASPADVDGDGIVTPADVVHFVASYRTAQAGGDGWDRRCDFDGDGKVTHQDAKQFIEAYLRDYRPVVRVADLFPEPLDSYTRWGFEDDGRYAGELQVQKLGFGPENAISMGSVDELQRPLERILWVVDNSRIVGFGGFIVGTSEFYTADPANAFYPPDPMDLGQTYTQNGNLTHNGQNAGTCRVTWQFLEADRTVTVPAGTFRNCVRVKITIQATITDVNPQRDVTIEVDGYFAPGIGLVKRKWPGADRWVVAHKITVDYDDHFDTYGQDPPSFSMKKYWPRKVGINYTFEQGGERFNFYYPNPKEVNNSMVVEWAGFEHVTGRVAPLFGSSLFMQYFGAIRGFTDVATGSDYTYWGRLYLPDNAFPETSWGHYSRTFQEVYDANGNKTDWLADVVWVTRQTGVVVETPAGRFENCVEMRFYQEILDAQTREPVPDQCFDFIMWFAEDVGPVKLLNYRDPNAQPWLLVSYSIPQ